VGMVLLSCDSGVARLRSTVRGKTIMSINLIEIVKCPGAEFEPAPQRAGWCRGRSQRPGPPVKTKNGGTVVTELTERQGLAVRALSAMATVLACVAIPGTASAAAPTPVSNTNCGGTVTKDSAPPADDPNLTDYTFHCDGPISAYTLIVNRRASDFDTIDDFTSDVSVIQTDGTPSATESVTCAATLPGDGINCNAGAGGTISAWYGVRSSFDLTDAYCKHFPVGARPGTEAIPQALIELVVTDATGAEDGPFRINSGSACPVVPDRVPTPPKKAKNPKKTRKSPGKERKAVEIQK
jgi:hypothetical protein